jgi:signal transduction histidine kinase
VPLWKPLRTIQPQDVVWLVLFAAMIATSPVRDVSEVSLLVLLAAVQIAEPRLASAAGTRNQISWILLKIVLAFLLIGHTGGVASRYYLLLLLPVLSAAMLLGVVATLLITLICWGTYLSFLLFVDWERYTMGTAQVRELTLRLVYLAVAGNLANAVAARLRSESQGAKAVARQLTDANRSLQRAEAAVRRSDRLAALGQLSAGLAHELRNPLGTIRASAEMLQKNLPAKNELAREISGFILSETDRTNALVTQFLDFARPLNLRIEPADLHFVLDNAIAQAERECSGHQVTVYKNYAAGLPPVTMDAAWMERVFYNLIVNAIQATTQGGAATVKTRFGDGRCEVDIIDRGSGIAADIREQIFNPFFTTKPAGVGLGLAIVSKILDEHGGSIAVESEPGKGSIFRVTLALSARRD